MVITLMSGLEGGRWKCWTAKISRGYLETALAVLKGGVSVEDYDAAFHGLDTTAEFTFGDDSRWEFVLTQRPNTTSIWSDTELKQLNAALAKERGK